MKARVFFPAPSDFKNFKAIHHPEKMVERLAPGPKHLEFQPLEDLLTIIAIFIFAMIISISTIIIIL